MDNSHHSSHTTLHMAASSIICRRKVSHITRRLTSSSSIRRDRYDVNWLSQYPSMVKQC